MSKRKARHVIFALSAIAAIAVLSPASAGKALALEGPGRTLQPANLLQAKNDPVISATGDRVLRAFIPPYPGTVRVRWDVRSSDGSLVFSAAVVDHLSNCIQNTTSKAFAAKVCDLRVAPGMPLYVYASPDSATNTALLRNVRVYYRVADSDGKTVVYDLPLAELSVPSDQPQ